jgi:hypothetical protein
LRLARRLLTALYSLRFGTHGQKGVWRSICPRFRGLIGEARLASNLARRLCSLSLGNSDEPNLASSVPRDAKTVAVFSASLRLARRPLDGDLLFRVSGRGARAPGNAFQPVPHLTWGGTANGDRYAFGAIRTSDCSPPLHSDAYATNTRRRTGIVGALVSTRGTVPGGPPFDADGTG